MTLEDDTYSKERGRNSDANMTSWPPLEYGHIFVYFITRPGLSWKQLEDDNYFQSKYVRTVHARRIVNGGTTLCILKAFVNPSQRTPDKAHQAWVVTKSNGHVVTADYTCMAG